MRKFRYDTSGTWFKGNTHIHSTASDGGKNFAEIAEMYAGAGYDFLFRTDHWVASDVESDDAEYPLLWCDGVELDGVDSTGSAFHVVCLGKFTGMDREIGLEDGIAKAREQGGVLILAHPAWCGNSFDDAKRWNFDGVEIYNHVCRWLNGKGDGRVYWEKMSVENPDTLSFATDDAHLKDVHPGWNGGWIMINADTLSRESVSHAIRGGNFYSSQGPEFKNLEFDGKRVKAEVSAVQFARLVGPASTGDRIGDFESASIDEFEFEISDDAPFAFLEIEDADGKRTWSNNLLKENKE